MLSEGIDGKIFFLLMFINNKLSLLNIIKSQSHQILPLSVKYCIFFPTSSLENLYILNYTPSPTQIGISQYVYSPFKKISSISSHINCPIPKCLAGYSLPFRTHRAFSPNLKLHLYHDDMLYLHFCSRLCIWLRWSVCPYVCIALLWLFLPHQHTVIFGRFSHLFFQINFKIVLSSSKNNVEKEKNVKNPIIIDLNVNNETIQILEEYMGEWIPL